MPARRQHRFYVDGPLRVGLQLSLSRPQSRQITDVFRLRRDDHLFLFDGSGFEFEARIVRPQKDNVVVEVERGRLSEPDPPPAIDLAVALIRSERFDLVVQKATELGVTALTPMTTSRTVVSLSVDRGARKLERWHRIAVEASEQAGRTRLPVISEPLPFDEVIAEAGSLPTILLWEGEQRVPLAGALSFDEAELRLLIGPEGGFTGQEVDRAVEHGVRVATLGPRILRAETAAIAAIAGVQALFSARHSERLG